MKRGLLAAITAGVLLLSTTALARGHAPAVLTVHDARAALSRYYQDDYFRIYHCTREGFYRVRCNDGLKLDTSGGAAWCNGYDLVIGSAKRTRVRVEGCEITVTLPR